MRRVLLAILLGCVLQVSARVSGENRPENPSDKAMELILEGEGNEESGNSRVRRTVKTCTSNIWPDNTVCYEFDSGLDATLESSILKAFKQFEDVSCVKFKEASHSDCAGVYPVVIRSGAKGTGCWAHIGNSKTQKTVLHMASECDDAGLGVILHELFHTLGRHHEQTRQDCEKYITINLDNIIDSKEGNYAKCIRDLHGIPYDLQSIVHYGSQYFQVAPDKDTMTVVKEKDKTYQGLMGKQLTLSRWDVVTLNKMYSCYSSPDFDATAGCEHGGVKIPNGNCFCEKPFEGSTCADIAPSDDKRTVKQTIIPAGNSEEIMSRNYPSNYDNDINLVEVLECEDKTKKVKITFKDFDVEKYEGYCFDKFNYFKGIGDIYGVLACGGELKGKSITSEGNYMTITFKTDDMYKQKGFDFVIECV